MALTDAERGAIRARAEREAALAPPFTASQLALLQRILGPKLEQVLDASESSDTQRGRRRSA